MLYDGLSSEVFFWCVWLDELDIAHCQELLDHCIWSEYDLSFLHLHCCPAVAELSHENQVIDRGCVYVLGKSHWGTLLSRVHENGA